MRVQKFVGAAACFKVIFCMGVYGQPIISRVNGS